MSATVKTLFLSICAVLLAYYCRRQSDFMLKDQLNDVLQGLIRAEEKVRVANDAKVAIGFGACIDYFADGLEVFSKVYATVPENPEHLSKITCLDDLTKTFAFFFQQGAAAE